MGAPLTLAAAATAVGFFSFLPTAYGGFSELGEIAGVGMIVAYLGSITLLPALLSLLKPPGEPEPVGFSVLAPIDFLLNGIGSRSSSPQSLLYSVACRCCFIYALILTQ